MNREKMPVNAKKITLLLLPLAVLLIAGGVILSLMTGSSQVTTYSMGSYVQQTVYGQNREEALQEAASRIALLEDKISWRVEGSDVQRLNAEAGGDFIEIDPTVYRLLQTASAVSQESGGAFDLTIAPLSRLWDFDSGKQLVPDAAQVETFVQEVDYTRVLLREGYEAALKTHGTAIDLGAIGKGAACDTAVQAYADTGAGCGIVAVGGSVGMYGKKPFGDTWRVAVRDPESAAAMGELQLDGGFVSTSGSYEKAFEQDGRRYHHLLDPATGYPAETGLLSVTVLAGSGAESDALATACFVLGLEDSLPLLSACGAEALFISEDHTVYVTGGLQGRFRITNDLYRLRDE